VINTTFSSLGSTPDTPTVTVAAAARVAVNLENLEIGNVRKFEIGQEKVKDNSKSQGKCVLVCVLWCCSVIDTV